MKHILVLFCLSIPTLFALVSTRSASRIVDYRPFLDRCIDRITSTLGTSKPYPIPDDLRIAHSSSGSITETIAFSVGPLRQVRACIIRPEQDKSPGVRVLNFVAFPFPEFDLPVFGADLVSLPGGHLIMIDLHPMMNLDHHAALVYPLLTSIHAKYQSKPGQKDDTSKLPWGGDLPQEALPFFSSCALWSRYE